MQTIHHLTIIGSLSLLFVGSVVISETKCYTVQCTCIFDILNGFAFNFIWKSRWIVHIIVVKQPSDLYFKQWCQLSSSYVKNIWLLETIIWNIFYCFSYNMFPYVISVLFLYLCYVMGEIEGQCKTCEYFYAYALILLLLLMPYYRVIIYIYRLENKYGILVVIV